MKAATFAACMLALASGAAHAQEIVFIAPTNHAMPLAQFSDGMLSGGIIWDLGNAIAQRLGRKARFVSVPSKRVGMVLANGEADGVCYVLPHWIDGDFHWSRPLIPNGVLVVSDPTVPAIRSLGELGGRRVGTVIGYRYPELEAVLGKQFLRDDAPSTKNLLSKLAAGRTKYAIVERATLDYHWRNDNRLRVRADLMFVSFNAQCAFSRSSPIPFAQIERAIDALAEQGGVDTIVSNYR